MRSEWLKACRAFSCPAQVVTLQDRAAAAEWSVCWQKLLSHQRCRRPEEAASRPLTDSDQSAYMDNASRVISSELIPPRSAKVTVLIRVFLTKWKALSFMLVANGRKIQIPTRLFDHFLEDRGLKAFMYYFHVWTFKFTLNFPYTQWEVCSKS